MHTFAVFGCIRGGLWWDGEVPAGLPGHRSAKVPNSKGGVANWPSPQSP